MSLFNRVSAIMPRADKHAGRRRRLRFIGKSRPVFIRDVFSTFATEVFTIGTNFAVGILLARVLSVADRGTMVLVMSLPMMIVSLATLGIPQSCIYLIDRKKHDANLVFGTMLTQALIISLITLLLLISLRQIILGTLLRSLPPGQWVPLIAMIPVLMVDTMAVAILSAKQRFDLYNVHRATLSLLLLIGFAISLLFLRGGLSAAVMTFIIATTLTTTIGLWFASREVRIRLRWDHGLAMEGLRFGLKSYFQYVVSILNYRLDLYLLAFWLAPTQVAFFGVATSLAEMAWFIPNSVGTVLFPRLAHAHMDEVHEITARVSRNTVVITGALVLGLLAVAWFLVPLAYGAPYRAAVPPLIILLPGIVIMSLFKVLTRDYTSRDRQQIPLLASSVALVLNVALNWLLIPRWAAVGAAVASTGGYLISGVLLMALFIHESGLTWQAVLLPRKEELVGHWRWTRMHLKNLQRARERV
ncbi:MAG TPA: oligosaccharide flippase family protein [Chloroflexi bacterium]|nr:oligosaccharide flippase family protein [Chloroflexota bacterium]